MNENNFNNGVAMPNNPDFGAVPPMNPMNTENSQKKKLKLVSIIAGLLCVVFIFISAFSVSAGSFLDVPIFEMALDESELKEAKSKLKDGAEEFDKYLDRAKDADIAEIEDMFGVSTDELVDIFKNPSLNDMIYLVEVLKKETNALEMLDSEELEEAMELLDMDETEEALDLFETIRMVIWGYAIFIAIFALLGALLKMRGFTIAAMVVSLPFYIFLAGWLFLAIYYVLSIAHIVLVSKAKRA